MSDDKQPREEVRKGGANPQVTDRPSVSQQSPKSKISEQVNADLRAHLRPELRKLYDLYYRDGA